MPRKEKETPEVKRPGCSNCGYPHALPPKCRACGADIEAVEEVVETEEE